MEGSGRYASVYDNSSRGEKPGRSNYSPGVVIVRNQEPNGLVAFQSLGYLVKTILISLMWVTLGHLPDWNPGDALGADSGQLVTHQGSPLLNFLTDWLHPQIHHSNVKRHQPCLWIRRLTVPMKIEPDFMGDRDTPKDDFSTIYMKNILSTRAETYLKGYSTWCKKK